ncbi:MAG: DUF5665 domain-containing protein [Bacillota bacterium]
MKNELDNIDNKFKKKVLKKLDNISRKVEGITLAEYVEMIRSPFRMIMINFLAGLARGLGIAIGATILGAIFLAVLFKLGQMNLPVIGEFIARLIKVVQTYL